MKKGKDKAIIEEKGAKKVVKELKEKAEKLTEGQKKTLAMHRPTWRMRVWTWFLAKKLVWMMKRERVRAWLLVPGIPSEPRKNMARLMKAGRPIPVFRDPNIAGDIQAMSRKDLERLAVIQATHLRAYLEMYGKTLVNLIAIDGSAMTRQGAAAQKGKG